MGVTVVNLVERTERPVLTADPAQHQIVGCQWASTTHLVCTLLVASQYPRAGAPPMAMLSARLVAVDVRTAMSRMLQDDGRPYSVDRFMSSQLLAVRPNDPDHVLIASAQRWSITERTIEPRVDRVSLVDDSRTRVQAGRNGIDRWLADPNGDVRVGLSINRSSGRLSVLREGEWQSTLIGSVGGEYDFEALFVDARGERLLIAARAGVNTRGVHELDAGTGRITRTLFADPARDFLGSVLVTDGEPQALLAHSDRWHFVPLTDEWRALAKELAAVMPEQGLVPWTTDHSGQTFTVRSTVPHVPTTG